MYRVENRDNMIVFVPVICLTMATFIAVIGMIYVIKYVFDN